MEINYKKNIKLFRDINGGTCFRLVNNGETIYMKLDYWYYVDKAVKNDGPPDCPRDIMGEFVATAINLNYNTLVGISEDTEVLIVDKSILTVEY